MPLLESVQSPSTSMSKVRSPPSYPISTLSELPLMRRAEAFSSLSPIFTSLWPLKPSSSLASSAMVHSPLSISSRERVNEKEGSSRFSLTILPLTLRLAETTLSSASLISPVITSVPGFVTIAPSEGEVIWHAGAVFIFSDSLEQETAARARQKCSSIKEFFIVA